jgi:hypothetical protein
MTADLVDFIASAAGRQVIEDAGGLPLIAVR